jgi:hypothetical protein
VLTLPHDLATARDRLMSRRVVLAIGVPLAESGDLVAGGRIASAASGEIEVAPRPLFLFGCAIDLVAQLLRVIRLGFLSEPPRLGGAVVAVLASHALAVGILELDLGVEESTAVLVG